MAQTIKNIEGIEVEDGINAIFEYRLKQEAIKWIQDLMREKQRCVPIGEKEDGMGFWYIQDIQANWIKHFFSLTDKDLEEENE